MDHCGQGILSLLVTFLSSYSDIHTPAAWGSSTHTRILHSARHSNLSNVSHMDGAGHFYDRSIHAPRDLLRAKSTPIQVSLYGSHEN